MLLSFLLIGHIHGLSPLLEWKLMRIGTMCCLSYVLHPNSVSHTHIRHSKHVLVSERSVLEGHQGFGNPEEEAMTAMGRSREISRRK